MRWRETSGGSRIAVRFGYAAHDDSGSWFHSLHWPLGRRPDGHPGPSELGL